MAKKYINLKLDQAQAEILARFMTLIYINSMTNPQFYGVKVDILKLTLDHVDYLIHEDGKWCDREDCSYWTKKKALENNPKAN